eukprot:755138-Hanusia_phi.AAC.6
MRGGGKVGERRRGGDGGRARGWGTGKDQRGAKWQEGWGKAGWAGCEQEEVRWFLTQAQADGADDGKLV